MSDSISSSGFPEEVSTFPEKRVWHRSTLFNAFIIGGVGFLAPGLWNAMNSLGAGGAESPYLINAANALVFGLSILSNDESGSTANRDRAGLFWASEGAVALGYPEPTKRGQYMNIWLWFRTGGPLLGSAIVLGLNHSAVAKKKGKVGSETYLIFVALQCLAVPLAYFLTRPEKVQRSDGSKVKVIAQDSWRAEFYELWRVSARKEILLLLPIFWAAYFNQYTGIQEQYTANPPSYDWSDKGFAKGMFVIILWRKNLVPRMSIEFAQQALQNWLYYLLSTMTDNISELSRLSGVLRGQESFAQAVSYGLNTREWYGGRVPLAVNTILLGLAVLPTWLVVKDHTPIEHSKSVDTWDSPQDEEQPLPQKGDRDINKASPVVDANEVTK
ncbi:UNC93-like protein [Penicillium subrubescens]|uniref:UNC93-like protein n=1 Tax=Penicillium subrubescens TaxID=1316194 RepID=A0A1Q5TI94_9EURO|nr:UNC93-like protein [Penicillium subrubescens]